MDETFVNVRRLSLLLGLLILGHHGLLLAPRYAEPLPDFAQATPKFILPFADLPALLKADKGTPVPSAGYLTDRDISPMSTETAYFLAAQNVLAPAVIEVNNPALPLLLIDNRAPSLEKISREFPSLHIIYQNSSGVILAKQK